jgi:2',3'-cyclic-nucleotide 2'-phosphodiesterase (5'-nucleotidase family)
MHTNDTHANLDNAAKRATAIKEVRAAKQNTLLVDAGDVFSGTLYFNEFQGEADLKLMNLMDYDFMTFGNHEFDLGSSNEGHQALADFVKDAKFAFVSSNVDFSEDNKFTGLFHTQEVEKNALDGNIYNSVIKTINGQEVGIIGLTTAETIDISSPGSVEFQNYLAESQKAVNALKAQGVNKIIALTHIGYDDNPQYDNDLELAKAVEGIDVIVGGHSHTFLGTDSTKAETYQPVIDRTGAEPTVIVTAYQYSTFLGTLDVQFDQNGKVISHAGKLVDLKTKTDDVAAAALLKPYADQVTTIKTQSSGANAVAPLVQNVGGEAVTRKYETNLGNLITDGMLAKAKGFNPNTVIALQNGGGIRANINAGDITIGEILTTLPFGNTLATMNLKGSEIKAALEHSVRVAPTLNGGFLQVSGLKFTYDSSKAALSRVVSVEVQGVNGTWTALNDTTDYVVATNAFTAKGGDGFTMFGKAYAEGRVTDLGLADWEVFRDYAKSLVNVNPQVEGRIIDVKNVTVAAPDFSGTTEAPKVYNNSVYVDATGVTQLKNVYINGNLTVKGSIDQLDLNTITVTGETIFVD